MENEQPDTEVAPFFVVGCNHWCWNLLAAPIPWRRHSTQTRTHVPACVTEPKPSPSSFPIQILTVSGAANINLHGYANNSQTSIVRIDMAILQPSDRGKIERPAIPAGNADSPQDQAKNSQCDIDRLRHDSDV